MGPHPIGLCPYKGGNVDIKREMHTGKMSREGEGRAGVMCLQAKKCQKFPVNYRSEDRNLGQILHHSLQKEPTLLTP